MLEITVDAKDVVARFDSMPSRLREALVKKIYYFTTLLEQKVKEGLRGALLNFITGELYASIYSNVTENGDSIVGKVASSASSKAAPYARIQEFGGTTKAHVIEAVNGQALKFKMGGKDVFFKRVNHPGSHIPAHHYIGGPFDEIKPQVGAGLKQAAVEAMK